MWRLIMFGVVCVAVAVVGTWVPAPPGGTAQALFVLPGWFAEAAGPDGKRVWYGPFETRRAAEQFLKSRQLLGAHHGAVCYVPCQFDG